MVVVSVCQAAGVWSLLLLVSVPWWLRLVQGFVQTSWWERLVSAHRWVELSLTPVVGRAVSWGTFRGGYALRTTLGSCSADGWGCVPTLLAVWSEAFQRWRL